MVSRRRPERAPRFAQSGGVGTAMAGSSVPPSTWKILPVTQAEAGEGKLYALAALAGTLAIAARVFSQPIRYDTQPRSLRMASKCTVLLADARPVFSEGDSPELRTRRRRIASPGGQAGAARQARTRGPSLAA